MIRSTALLAAIAISLLAVSGAGGASGLGQQSPHVGGTVVFGPVAEFSCLNLLVPETCGESNIALFWIVEKVLEPAFAVGPDFGLRPKLVSRVTYTTKPPFTLTYTIQPEARWSDGVAVTARDFVFTHSAILRYTPPDFAVPHPQVRSIRALGAKTVRVVLRSRIANWRGLFPFVLPRHALVNEDLKRIWADRIENPETGEPIGSGPFLVERWERGKRLTLLRNPHYWGPHPAYIDRLVIRFCQACTAPPPKDVLAGMRSGDVDFALSRDTGIAPDLRRIPGIRVLAMHSTGWEHLDLRIGPGGNPALRSKLVRRAIAFGIDRVAIVRQLIGDVDPAYRPSDSAAFLNTNRNYRPNWNRYRYRPSVAHRLLQQAGCRTGADGIYVCAGQRLSLSFVTIAGVPLRERGLQLMQPQLRKAGIEVVPTFAPLGAFFDQIIPSGSFDAISYSFFLPSEDAIATKGIFGCGGELNYTGYCQRLTTSDLDEANRILDRRRRAAVLNHADRQLAKDVPVIPLYQVPFVLAMRRSLNDVVVSPFNLFWNAENWWLER